MINWLDKDINLDVVKKQILDDSYDDRYDHDYYDDRRQIIMRHLELFARVKLTQMIPERNNERFFKAIINELDVSIDFADAQILASDNMNYVFIKTSAITLKMYIMKLITDNFQQDGDE